MRFVRVVLLITALCLSAPLSAKEYVRSGRVHRAFLQASGYPHGRPGYVADHIFPLCAGGTDRVENLQWQSIADGKVKDVAEKQLCARIRTLVAGFDRRWRPMP